jgi:hypothetical protein
VVKRFASDPVLAVLLLQDAADPGFPSFPVLRVDQHLRVFGKLLPDIFINQVHPTAAAGWAGSLRTAAVCGISPAKCPCVTPACVANDRRHVTRTPPAQPTVFIYDRPITRNWTAPTQQGGDPFLAALYRGVAGALGEAPEIRVVNLRGGPQLDGRPYNPPRYRRRSPPQQAVLRELRAARLRLLEDVPEGPDRGVLSVDVLVPSFRVDVSLIEVMAKRIT